MANFVRSFGESVKRYFTPRPVGRRAKRAFPSLFQRWWRSIPSYLPFYILVAVLAYALWYGLQPATVIAPFHLPPENKDKPLPFSGETVADVLQDAITSIQREAAGEALPPPCDAMARKEEERRFGGLKAEAGSSFQVRGPVTVEVKGISPEAVASAAREVLGKEKYISGDVVLSAPNLFQLMARTNDRGPWMTKPQEISLDGLKYASCELAERILGATNKNVLAAAWLRREKYDDVIRLYGNLPSKSGDPDALTNLGIALREKGKLDDAITRLQQALRVSYGLPQAHYNLGVALVRKGEDDEAINEYRNAIKLKPDYAEAYTGLGLALYDKKQYDEAIAECRKATELKPDDPDLHYYLGLALEDKKQYDEAIAEYRKVLELKPDHRYALKSLDIALYSKKQYDEAIAKYRKAIELKPDDPDGHTNLGNALRDKGKYDEAIAEYRKAIELKPDDPVAHTELGNALRDKGKYDEAIAEFRKAIELEPDYAEAHGSLGDALLANGQTDEAIAEYRWAITLNPDDAEARDNLAKALAHK